MERSPLRMTCQRQIILEELRKLKTHPTADDVYRLVRRRLPRISLGTVYRNLETLSNSNLVQKLELGGSQRRFDGDVSAHYHVRCRECGRVADVAMAQLTEIQQQVQAFTQYEVTGHRLEFIGICPPCGGKNQPTA